MTDAPDIDAVVERLDHATTHGTVYPRMGADVHALLADHARLAKGRAVLEAAVKYAELAAEIEKTNWLIEEVCSDFSDADDELHDTAIVYAEAIKEMRDEN